MSFIEDLLFGIIGNKVIDDLEQNHDHRMQDRERERMDSLFWQDAARRDSAAFVEDDDDFLGLL